MRWGRILGFVICLSCLHLTIGVKPPKSPPTTTVNCDLDDDGLNPRLSACLALGRRALKQYLRRLKRWNTVDRCEDTEEFRACIAPFIGKCSAIRERLETHWKPVLDMLQCACSQNPGCQRSLECLEEEMGSVMVRRCDEFYRFNVDQKTLSTCHFLRKSIQCTEALVSSACGAEAGAFLFHATKLATMARIRKLRCYVERHRHDFQEFRYAGECPRNFTAAMDSCNTQFLSGTALHFSADNNLVAEGDRGDVRVACRDYRRYQYCMRETNRTCAEGTKLIYAYDGRLRTYLLKMEYICHEARGYSRYLPCYQQVVHNETLLSCKALWETLRPLLDNITSYQFYCESKSWASRKVGEQLLALRMCYQRVFETSCGGLSAATMGRLIALAFADPRYLRFGYVAECSAHVTSKPSTRAPTEVTAVASMAPARRGDGVTSARQPARASEWDPARRDRGDAIRAHAVSSAGRTSRACAAATLALTTLAALRGHRR